MIMYLLMIVLMKLDKDSNYLNERKSIATPTEINESLLDLVNDSGI